MPPLYHFPLSRRHGDRLTQELVPSSTQLALGLITFRGFSLTIADAHVQCTGAGAAHRVLTWRTPAAGGDFAMARGAR